MPEILLAAKVAFRRLNRGVTEQELNLFKLTATSVTQLCAGSSQIVWGDMVQARFFAAIPYHVPHHVLGDTPAELWSKLSQFPERWPSCFTPFTRLMPAASSGLSSPASAASSASRRTAASC